MNKKNSDTLNQQSTATDTANSSNKFIKKQQKIERFAELLLKSGLTGVARWVVLGKQKSTNPGSFASDLRKLNINITKGRTYILMDFASAKATVNFINSKRAKRNAEPLTDDVIKHWLQPFVNAKNEVAA